MTDDDSSVIEELNLEDELRKTVSGPLLDFQEEVDDETVYCSKCDVELGYTPSELLVHNIRRHEEEMDS